jgi:hypothetical protein
MPFQNPSPNSPRTHCFSVDDNSHTTVQLLLYLSEARSVIDIKVVKQCRGHRTTEMGAPP